MIPARGGSKGIPKKNLTLLGGEPLIAYSIRAALRSRHITRVIVSTDDTEIAGVSRSLGAEVPFLRPARFAADNSNMVDVFQHVLARLNEQHYVPEFTVHLFPTSPFRTSAFIDMMIEKLFQGHCSARTVKRMPQNVQYYFFENTSNKPRLVPLTHHTNLLREYGIFFGANRDNPTKGDYLHCVDDPIMLIDIDYPADLAFAEAVIQNNLFDFKFL